MKSKIINIRIAAVLLALTILSLSGCKKIEDQFPSKTVKVTYPGIALKGGPVVINPGDTYSDAGATLTDDITGATSDIQAVSSNVDATTPGLYFVTYEAANANGFKTVIQRPVLVTSVSDSIDLTGTYKRQSNGWPVQVAKVGRGLFTIDNVGGVPDDAPGVPSAVKFQVYMGVLDETTMTIPPQIMPDGTILDCVDETLDLTPPTSFSYVVDNVSFGTATRVFVKE